MEKNQLYSFVQQAKYEFQMRKVLLFNTGNLRFKETQGSF